MGISKFFWNLIKKDAELDLNSFKELTENAKVEIKAEIVKYEKATTEYINHLKGFESPNQFIMFLYLAYPGVINNIKKQLKNDFFAFYYKYVDQPIKYTITTLTDFNNFNNQWTADVPDDTEYASIAIGFDKKITGNVCITWDSYNDKYSLFLQNESWAVLHSQERVKQELFPAIRDIIRIDCPAKPALYVMAITKNEEEKKCSITS